MKIPKKLLTSAGKLFKKASARKEPKMSAWQQLGALERYRDSTTSASKVARGRKIPLRSDKYGNKASLAANAKRVSSWRTGETYGPGEHSKFTP